MSDRSRASIPPIRVLAIDHTAGVAPYRRKFAALAAHPEIDLTVLAPDRWVESYRAVRALPARADGYRLDVGGVIWPAASALAAGQGAAAIEASVAERRPAGKLKGDCGRLCRKL